MMSESRPLTAYVITVSDSCWHGERSDLSGPAACEELRQRGWVVSGLEIVPDEPAELSSRLAAVSDAGGVDLLITAGGTGFSPRDQTPEATASILEREIPGLPEVMRAESRKSNPRAVLTRAKAGIRGRTIILNLPGSVRGIRECFEAIGELLPHAVELVRGTSVRCGG